MPRPAQEKSAGSNSLAVMLIDMQTAYLAYLQEQERDLVTCAQIEVIRKCALQDTPVIVIEYDDKGPTLECLRKEVAHVPRHYWITKMQSDAFGSKELWQVLEELKAGKLLLMGAYASYCVLKAATSALKRGHSIVTSDTLIIDPFDEASRGKSLEWYSQNGTLIEGPVNPAEL